MSFVEDDVIIEFVYGLGREGKRIGGVGNGRCGRWM